MTNRDQDLRTALEWYGEQARLARLIHSGGDPGRHALAEDGGKRAAAILAAPPRPVDAERVAAWDGATLETRLRSYPAAPPGSDAMSCGYVSALMTEAADALASPAHSPDKAVARDGVAEAFEDAALARDEAGYSGTPASCIRFLSAELDRLEKALAPKPTGTEAGRGVIPAGWKLVPSKLTYAMADDLFRTTWPVPNIAAAQALWDAMLAATPTPPVSPLQITWIGDQKQGVEIILKTSEWDSEAHRHEEPYPGMVVTFDPDGSILDISIEDLSADMAPPVPGVSPTPDSTGPAGNMPGDITQVRLELCEKMAEDADFPEQRHGFRVEAENIRRKLAALTPSAPIAAPVRDDGARERALMEVVKAASDMPRETPAPGGAFTVHPFQIAASTVWALDRALRNLASLPAPAGDVPGEAQSQEGGR